MKQRFVALLVVIKTCLIMSLTANDRSKTSVNRGAYIQECFSFLPPDAMLEGYMLWPSLSVRLNKILACLSQVGVLPKWLIIQISK